MYRFVPEEINFINHISELKRRWVSAPNKKIKTDKKANILFHDSTLLPY